MCTGIRLKAENDAIIYSRTLEFGIDTKSHIIVIPQNYEFMGITNLNKQGLNWQSKYAVVGANMLNLMDIVDGVNEMGLAGGLFYFPGYAKYQEQSTHDFSKAIAPWQLMTWILTNFSTVDEVKKHIPEIKVTNTVFEAWGIIPPLHAIVHDLSGKSLVIEYINGELVLYDNPLGVITNSPGFDWHITNLSNYINLSPFNIDHKKIDGVIVKPLGQGSGMLGLPGDFTSPSRFVRATAFMETLINLKDEQIALDAAFHLLNLFDIPFGSVVEKANGQFTYEFTQWTTAADLKHKRYYWHTHENRQVYMIDLMNINTNTDKPLMLAMHRKKSIIELK